MSEVKRSQREVVLTPGVDIPVYQQLRTILRQQIKDGAFAPQSPMPSELQLAATYGVSRVTVRKALDVLANEGLVVRRHGVGTFVAVDNLTGTASEPPRLAGLVENLMTKGLKTSFEHIAFDPAYAPPARVATAMGLGGGEVVHLSINRRCVDAMSLVIVYNYVPTAVGTVMGDYMNDERPLADILESYGFNIGKAYLTMTAVPADHRVASGLGVAVSSPVIRLTRTTRDVEGQTLMLQVGFYNPDHYEYRSVLTRETGGTHPQWKPIG